MTAAGALSGYIASATGDASGAGAACALARAAADVVLLVCALGDAVAGVESDVVSHGRHPAQ